jgi:hypothetical protein
VGVWVPLPILYCTGQPHITGHPAPNVSRTRLAESRAIVDLHCHSSLVTPMSHQVHLEPQRDSQSQTVKMNGRTSGCVPWVSFPWLILPESSYIHTHSGSVTGRCIVPVLHVGFAQLPNSVEICCLHAKLIYFNAYTHKSFIPNFPSLMNKFIIFIHILSQKLGV